MSCVHCGGCDHPEKCNHCNKCKHCGQEVRPPEYQIPYTPYIPAPTNPLYPPVIVPYSPVGPGYQQPYIGDSPDWMKTNTVTCSIPGSGGLGGQFPQTGNIIGSSGINQQV